MFWLDQKHITFSQHDSEGLGSPGSYHGHVLDLATGRAAELEGLYAIGRSSFSPDRRHFLYAPRKVPSAANPRIYVDPAEQERGLQVVDTATGQRQTIFRPDPQLNLESWGWSPDGSRVVFTQRLIDPANAGTVSLWAAATDGSNRRLLAPNQLTPLPAPRAEPTGPQKP